MLRKHILEVLIAILFVFIFVVGIKLYNFKTVQNTQSSSEKPRIALIAHVANNPYWQIVKKGAEKAAKERGCILEYYGSSTANADEDLNFINMNIAAKVDGIITYVQEEGKYSPAINKGIEKGIPIITIDTDAKNSKRNAYVGTDNIEAGKKAGRILWEKTSGDHKIGVIMAGFDTTNQVERLKGLKDYLSDKSKADIVSIESSNSNELNAKIAAEKIINEHPEVNFLYCVSAVDGIGAAKAVTEYNLQSKITIICFDDLPETLELIKNGVIYASIVQKPYDMGYKSVNMIMDKIGGKVLKSVNITNTIIVTQSNVNSYNKNQKE